MNKRAYSPVRKAHAKDRPAARAPTDDLGFAQVRLALTSPILLALAGCSAAGGQSQTSNEQGPTPEQLAAADNMAAEIEPGWTEVSPDLVFNPKSAARTLPRPPALKGALVGFYGDPVMIRQYTRHQLAQMRADHAGFALTRDLDGDGVAETYRTGFWRIGDVRTGDAREGSFLVVFDPGRPPQVIDSASADEDTGVFISGAGDRLDVAWCNCPGGRIGYKSKRLSVTWHRR